MAGSNRPRRGLSKPARPHTVVTARSGRAVATAEVLVRTPAPIQVHSWRSPSLEGDGQLARETIHVRARRSPFACNGAPGALALAARGRRKGARGLRALFRGFRAPLRHV